MSDTDSNIDREVSLEDHLSHLPAYRPPLVSKENILKSSYSEDPLIAFYLCATSASKILLDVVKAEVDEALKPYHIQYQHWCILKLIHIDYITTPTQMADSMNFNKTHLTRLLDHLEARSLILRNRSEEDRRLIRTTLTERGIYVTNVGLKVFQTIPKLFKQNLSTLEHDYVSAMEAYFLTHKDKAEK